MTRFTTIIPILVAFQRVGLANSAEQPLTALKASLFGS